MASSPSVRAIALPGTTATTFPRVGAGRAACATPTGPDGVTAAAAPWGNSARSNAAAPRMLRGLTLSTLRPTIPALDGKQGNSAGQAGKWRLTCDARLWTTAPPLAQGGPEQVNSR